MTKLNRQRRVRVFSIIFVLSLCLITVRPHTLFAKQTPLRAVTYQYQNDKILKVVEVRNLQKDTYLQDLEIEIKNVSGKPIYFMYLWLHLPEIPPPPGATITAVHWEYGNRGLINNERLAEESDIPIKPGEAFVYKVPKDQVKNLYRLLNENDIVSVTHVVLSFDVINFGDGTGFEWGQPAKNRVRKPNLESSSSVAAAVYRIQSSLLAIP